MTGLIERMRDTATLCRTDKRIWSGGAFLLIVVSVWAMTTSWREPPPEKEKVVRTPPPQGDFVRNALADFKRDFDERQKAREQFNAEMRRTQSELAADKQQVEWHMNELVGKLDNMANRVDKLADKIGSRAINESEVDRKIKAQSKKKKPTKVDPGEM